MESLILAGLLPQAPRLDHIGIATGEPPHPLTRLLRASLEFERAMPSGVLVQRFGLFEVISPARSGSPIDQFLRRRGAGLHHVALATAVDLEEVARDCQQRGLETAGDVQPGSDGRRTLFLHPRDVGGVLVELVEERT
jgi:methylmalonyl-CoA/ethylmalonyl-CoA epimerase